MNIVINNALKELSFEEFKDGSESAFEICFAKFYPVLAIFSYKYTNDESQSQDIASDVLMKAFTDRKKFESEKHLISFLYYVTRNDSVNFLRHEKFENKKEKIFLSNTFSEVDILNSQLDVALCEHIYLAIEKLPTRTKQIITSLYIDQLSYKEVSELYGVTKKNIENVRHYGLCKMKLFLTEIYKQTKFDI